MEEELERLLQKAVAYHATDIHLEVRDEVEVSFRTPQGFVKGDAIPLELFRYIQYRSNLDIGNGIDPQTGRFQIEIDDTAYSIRFAVLHSFQVTSGVLRILNAKNPLNIKDLTLDAHQQQYFHSLWQKPNGLILFTGPTGSGKTTALYTILKEVKGKKVFSIEDPVEVLTKDFIQLQVNTKQHLGYAEGIKQLLRHDPDIIMIGEIRDEEAAQMAVRCALTGHLVLSTLHASSSAGAIERLLELGVNRRQLNDVLEGVMNQRLCVQANQKRVGVYEVMDRKEIDAYFETHRCTPSFQTLSSSILELTQKGLIQSPYPSP